MGFFDHTNPPDRWEPRWIMGLILKLRTAINAITESNFPNPLKGDTLIREGTLSLNRLSGAFPIWTFLALATPQTTTATTLQDVGGQFFFDASLWPTTASKFVLEVFAGPMAINGQTTVSVYDATGEVASLSLPLMGQAYYKATFSKAPATGPIKLKFCTNSGAVAAGITTARMLLIP